MVQRYRRSEMFRIGAKYRAAPKRVLNTRLISVHHLIDSFGILYQKDYKEVFYSEVSVSFFFAR